MAGKENTREEDSCEYLLFPPDLDYQKAEDVKEYLEDKKTAYLSELWTILSEYIWQNEPFRLRPVLVEPAHLYGKTNFGDNVEDEWFIVYLLCQLTKLFPGLVAKIDDNDGEFMLIEAANVLPKWLEPDTAENRVFIYDGKLHIIPNPQSPAEITTLPSGIPDLTDAVACIRDNSKATIASEAVQAAIQKKIEGYPEKIKQSLHRAHCYVPAALAAVLKQSPQLIAPAVRAFYYRDPIDLKACRIMTHFRPGTRIMTEILFTRCLYAQLMQQRFQPDRRADWTIPSSSNPKYKSYDVGMKLAHGFEILCAQCAKQGDEHERNGSGIDPGWPRYLKSLKDKGYFKHEIQGSKAYQDLYEEAKKFYHRSVMPENDNATNPGAEIHKILETVKYDIEEMRKQEKLLRKPDDDSWLEITPEKLDEIMHKMSGKQSANTDLSAIPSGVQAFINKESSYEGAEVPEPGEEGEIQFDAGGFIQSMQKIFEFEDPASDSESDMSEYGWSDDGDYDGLGGPPRREQKKGKKPVPKVQSTSPESAKNASEDVQKITEYMKLMDRELANTEVGKSFEKVDRPTPPPRPKHQKKKEQIKSAAGNNIQNSLNTPQTRISSDLDIDDIDDDFTPVNIDMNTVKNLLESYTSQHGMAGPTSNLLGSMGVKLPPPSK